MIYLLSPLTKLPPVLRSGDTVNFSAGNYPGFSVAGLTNVWFTFGAGAILTGTIKGGNTSNLKFIGLTYQGSGTTFDPGVGNNVGLNFLNSDFGNAGVVFEGAGNIITYKGTPETALYSGLQVIGFKFAGNCLYNGTWEAPTTFHNVNLNMVISGGTINCAGVSATKVFGNSIYEFVARDIQISGAPIALNDVGVFMIESGNVGLFNIVRHGGYGYLLRLWQVGQDSVIEQCIDTDTIAYGVADVRIDAGLLNLSGGTMALVGGNVNF